MKLKRSLVTLFVNIFGKKIAGVRIVPITTKIIVVFMLFILASNLTTNYINLVSNREELVKTLKELLVKDLKELYTFSNNQFDIYQFDKNRESAINALTSKALTGLKKRKSIALGVSTNRAFLFEASHLKKKYGFFVDKASFRAMEERRKLGESIASGKTVVKGKEKSYNEGILQIRYNGEQYFAIYKYNKKWNAYVVRGEELNEFYAKSNAIFWNIAFISILITIACALVGTFLLKYILRFVHLMTAAIMKMSKAQNLELIEMRGATNDDVTFLGVAFNSLSSTISNMMQIFRKFVNRDVVNTAYREKQVRLEGTKKELTCLFSDIKRFTYMTETLGTDIIALLNLHYDRAIREILHHDGLIGSIIGDALLAVYGALDESVENKSYQAIMSAYKIQEVAYSLRKRMSEIKQKIEKKMGKFSMQEEKVYEAVLIEVGVGIDGGDVFYGNIGSSERMTNTVIGDNVNAASRLEGLTRIYKTPVICSEFVKKDVEDNLYNHGLYFMEIDTVQVKGKTIGKKIYWPIPTQGIKRKLKQNIEFFSAGLQLYYDGHWRKAEAEFKECTFEAARIFLSRIKGKKCPKDWNGIWAMKTK